MGNEILTRWWLLDYLFDRFRWYRRWCGDHWELWYIDITASFIWHNRKRCYRVAGRPACGRGEPVCEEYFQCGASMNGC